MKKICLLLATALILGCLAGCANTDQTEPSAEPSAPAEPSAEPTAPPTDPPTEPPVPVVVGYDLDIPEEFEASVASNEQMLYLSPDAPDDGSFIEILVTESDDSVLELDEEGFKELREVEGEYHSLELSVVQVDGISALFADYVLDQGRIWTHVYEYHVVGDQNYLFRFSDSTDDNDWLEMFADAADSINMLTENEGVELDYSGLEKYTLDCGVSLYAVPGMEKQTAPGFTDCLGSRDAIILVMQDDKQANDLDGLSIREYAGLVCQSNELDPFTQDSYGNLQTSFYSSDEQGQSYYNVLTVKETGDSFWVFQMTCTAEHQASYVREFSLWAASIREN